MIARAALDAGLAAAGGDHDDQAAGDDRHREPDADDAHPHRAASAVGARTAGEKRATSSAGATASPGSLSPTEAASSARTSSGGLAERGAVGERDGAVALGEPRAVLAEHQRDVRVAGRREAEALAEPELARRRVEQVGAAHDLADPLRRVVDDDGEVVRVGAVVAAHDEVVDDAGHGARDLVRRT